MEKRLTMAEARLVLVVGYGKATDEEMAAFHQLNARKPAGCVMLGEAMVLLDTIERLLYSGLTDEAADKILLEFCVGEGEEEVTGVLAELKPQGSA